MAFARRQLAKPRSYRKGGGPAPRRPAEEIREDRVGHYERQIERLAELEAQQAARLARTQARLRTARARLELEQARAAQFVEEGPFEATEDCDAALSSRHTGVSRAPQLRTKRASALRARSAQDVSAHAADLSHQVSRLRGGMVDLRLPVIGRLGAGAEQRYWRDVLNSLPVSGGIDALGRQGNA